MSKPEGPSSWQKQCVDIALIEVILSRLQPEITWRCGTRPSSLPYWLTEKVGVKARRMLRHPDRYLCLFFRALEMNASIQQTTTVQMMRKWSMWPHLHHPNPRTQSSQITEYTGGWSLTLSRSSLIGSILLTHSQPVSFSSFSHMDLSSAALHLYDYLDEYTFDIWFWFRLAGKYFQIAAFVMLAYDHRKLAPSRAQNIHLIFLHPVITLGQEVYKLWLWLLQELITCVRWRRFGCVPYPLHLCFSSSTAMRRWCSLL